MSKYIVLFVVPHYIISILGYKYKLYLGKRFLSSTLNEYTILVIYTKIVKDELN